MKIRTVLGEYWLAASWMATSVVANTTATTTLLDGLTFIPSLTRSRAAR